MTKLVTHPVSERIDARTHGRRAPGLHPVHRRDRSDGRVARHRVPGPGRRSQIFSNELRDDATQIPNFIEETLRIDSELKGTFRFCRTTKTVGDVEIPAGSTVMLLIGAANRDPVKFERPSEFPRSDRPNARQHLAFGRGPASVLGCSTRTSGEPNWRRRGCFRALAFIRISESAHGPAGARTYKYVPTYLSRSLRRLHLDLTPAFS